MPSKYEHYRKSLAESQDRPIDSQCADQDELGTFDWFGFQSTAPERLPMPDHLSVLEAGNETPQERKLRMLKPLSSACTACSMCELGLQGAEKNSELRDPHVFSNMNPSKFVIIGQNPGWNELKLRKPFVGAAGGNFDEEINRHGITRDVFYIGNVIRCFTPGNQKPNERHIQRCEPFLRMELGLLKPKLVITLGAAAFSQLCPQHRYKDSLKSIIRSDRYGVHVFPVYHPSPMNFQAQSRRDEFNEQIELLCGMIKKLRSRK